MHASPSSPRSAPFPPSRGPTRCPTASTAIPSIGGGVDRLRLGRRPLEGPGRRAASAHAADRPRGRGDASRASLPTARSIAFTAQYEGNDDVYVMPAAGGEPRAAHLPSRRRTRPSAGPPTARSSSAAAATIRTATTASTRSIRTGGIPQMIPLEPAAWISFEPGGTRDRDPEDRPRVPQLEALQGRRGRGDLRRHARPARLHRGHEVRRQGRLPDVGARTAASTS